MTLEDIKRDSDHLRGTLLAELQDESDSFSDPSTQILKFHGVYQQDDRDLRRGSDRTYVMMVRASLPGGLLTAEQYLVADGLADWVGNGTLRITTRQGLQWHHVRKGSLRSSIWLLNQSLVTTLGACGDVVRNVVACPSPEAAALGLPEWAARIARHFRPTTSAYYEVWIDGARSVVAEEPAGEQPIYGDAYLPRKFKIGIAAPGDNCVDVYTHDVGLVPIVENGIVERFTVLVGGGQGRTVNRPETYPRLADPLTTVPTDQVLDVIEAVVVVQRDNGDRENRKQARLKYLVDRWGLPRFREEVEATLGRRLPSPEPVPSLVHRDHFGWQRGGAGEWWLGVHVESGRIADDGDLRLRTALATIVDRFRPGIRLTAQQNLILTGIAEHDRSAIDELFSDHGVVPASERSPVVRDAMACVALPTCGLALTDAERAMPAVVRDLAGLLDEFELGTEEVGVRMTGCPNGCARPYSSEIGLIGHGKDRYDIRLGGARDGTRLNSTYVESVRSGSIAETLRPLVAAWAAERLPGETFGDFTDRWLVDEDEVAEAGR